jgi:hypothetical protein
MQSHNRYAALNSATLEALAKLRSVRAGGDETFAHERLVAQDEAMGFEGEHTAHDEVEHISNDEIQHASNIRVEHASVDEDEQAFIDEVEHTSSNMNAVSAEQGQGVTCQPSKKKRRRGKKGGVKSKKKGNGAVATGNNCADTTGPTMKAAEAPAVTEEVQACVLAVSRDKELEVKEPKTLEALQASIDTLGGIVNGCAKAAAMAILAGLSGAIMVGLVRFAS